MRAPRRWFTAPLVVTVAAPLACSSSGSPSSSARRDGGAGTGVAAVSDLGRITSVWRDGSACAMAEEERCPPGATCNPPPPRQVECPPWMGENELRIAQGPGGGCVDVPPGCRTSACATPSPCLDLADPVTLQWAITPGDDGRCVATPARRGGFDRVRPQVTIDCPTPARAGFVERPAAGEPCRACATSPCDPATSPAVACPPDAPP